MPLYMVSSEFEYVVGLETPILLPSQSIAASEEEELPLDLILQPNGASNTEKV